MVTKGRKFTGFGCGGGFLESPGSRRGALGVRHQSQVQKLEAIRKLAVRE